MQMQRPLAKYDTAHMLYAKHRAVDADADDDDDDDERICFNVA